MPRCAEYGRIERDGERGWRAYLVADGSASASSGAGRRRVCSDCCVEEGFGEG
jgi:hypothetical protein